MMLQIYKGIIRKSSEAGRNVIRGEGMLNNLPEYISALNFIEQHNWSMAEIDLKRCVEIVAAVNSDEKKTQNFLLTKLAYSQKQQKKYSMCEKNLEEVTKNLEKSQNFRDEPLYYQYYANLITQYLFSNPPKAASLGLTLKSSVQWQYFPLSAQKQITLCYGVNFI